MYRVGLWDIHLLNRYWDQLTIVTRTGGYYGASFKRFHRVTQGHPLSTTISNVVLDAVLHHWVTVVEATEEAVPPVPANMEGFG